MFLLLKIVLTLYSIYYFRSRHHFLFLDNIEINQEIFKETRFATMNIFQFFFFL